MNKKIVGSVTEEEKTEILRLFERRNGLNELAKILTDDKAELYERLVKDMGETSTKFQVTGITTLTVCLFSETHMTKLRNALPSVL